MTSDGFGLPAAGRGPAPCKERDPRLLTDLELYRINSSTLQTGGLEIRLLEHIEAQAQIIDTLTAQVAALMPLQTDQAVPAEDLIGIGKGLRDLELGKVKPLYQIRQDLATQEERESTIQSLRDSLRARAGLERGIRKQISKKDIELNGIRSQLTACQWKLCATREALKFAIAYIGEHQHPAITAQLSAALADSSQGGPDGTPPQAEPKEGGR